MYVHMHQMQWLSLECSIIYEDIEKRENNEWLILCSYEFYLVVGRGSAWKIQAWTAFEPWSLWLEPWPLWSRCSAAQVELSGQLGAGQYVGPWRGCKDSGHVVNQ